jgi:hypothetical protein
MFSSSLSNYFFDIRAEKLRDEQLQPFRKFLLRSFILQSTWFDTTTLPRNVLNICIDYWIEISFNPASDFSFLDWFSIVQDAMIRGLYCGKSFFIVDPFKPECDQNYLEIPIEYLIIHYFMSSKIGIYPSIDDKNHIEYQSAVREVRYEFSKVNLRYRKNLIEGENAIFVNYTRNILRIPDCNDWNYVVAEDVDAIDELPVNVEQKVDGFKIEAEYYNITRSYNDFLKFVVGKINENQLSKYRSRFINRELSTRQFGAGESNLVASTTIDPVVEKKSNDKKKSNKVERVGKVERVEKFTYVIDEQMLKNRPKNKQELKKQLGRKGAKDVERIWKKIQIGKM